MTEFKLKKKELELRERELAIREKELQLKMKRNQRIDNAIDATTSGASKAGRGIVHFFQWAIKWIIVLGIPAGIGVCCFAIGNVCFHKLTNYERYLDVDNIEFYLVLGVSVLIAFPIFIFLKKKMI